MTHIAEPMTLAQLSADIGQYDSGTVGTRRLRKWKAAIDAELAKQREAEPVVIPIPTIIDRTHLNRAYVTYGFTDEAECDVFIKATRSHSTPLYTHPQQRNAVEVTDFDEIACLALEAYDNSKEMMGLCKMRDALKIAFSAVASRDREDVLNAWLSEDDLDSLMIFGMQCDDMDADGYTVPTKEMHRLAELGVVRKVRGTIFEMTAFGTHLFDTKFGQLPTLPLRTIDEHNKAVAARRENKP